MSDPLLYLQKREVEDNTYVNCFVVLYCCTVQFTNERLCRLHQKVPANIVLVLVCMVVDITGAMVALLHTSSVAAYC